eukprot:1158289-Pelagomonas_calceolata.AAC.1
MPSIDGSQWEAFLNARSQTASVDLSIVVPLQLHLLERKRKAFFQEFLALSTIAYIPRFPRRDQAQTWYKEQLDEVNKVINEILFAEVQAISKLGLNTHLDCLQCAAMLSSKAKKVEGKIMQARSVCANRAIKQRSQDGGPLTGKSEVQKTREHCVQTSMMSYVLRHSMLAGSKIRKEKKRKEQSCRQRKKRKTT